MFDEASRPQAEKFVNMATERLVTPIEEVCRFKLDSTLIRSPVVSATFSTRWRWWCLVGDNCHPCRKAYLVINDLRIWFCKMYKKHTINYGMIRTRNRFRMSVG